MSVFKMDGILPPLMSPEEMNDSADWEKEYSLILAECDRIVSEEGLYRCNGIDYSTRSDATMARMFVAEQRVKARYAR